MATFFWAADLAKIGLLHSNLKRLSEVPSRVATPIATRLNMFAAKQFAAGTDVYGGAWAPTKAGTSPPLGGVASGARPKYVPLGSSGVGARFRVSYAQFHQGGTRHMPARPPLPSAGFPATWRALIDETCAKAFREASR